MTRRLFIGVFALFMMAGGMVLSGERIFSWTQAPGRGNYIAVNLGSYSLGKYLAESQVNRPEIIAEVQASLRDGQYYRKRTRDQKDKPTILTVHVDKDYMLRVVTYRDETCPVCKGTGKRAAPIDKITSKVNVNFQCLECKGTGYLENYTVEKYYVLSSEDFENPQEGRRIMSQRAYDHAPEGAQAWVERLASLNPRERLDACVWLDRNYVQTGAQFLDIQPMLKKARYHDSNTKKRIMVWQFWAGKDLPNEKNRAYYRIYADPKTGKITEKGFYSGS